MMTLNTIHDLYVSQDFRRVREVLMLERVGTDGYLRCEYCGKPILRPYDCIAHHRKEVTAANLHNVDITLNADNIMLVHHQCHNKIHNRFGRIIRKVYCVYGAPRSGKTTYVESVANAGDLIMDIDRLWMAVSGLEFGHKPKELNAVVFGLRDRLYEDIIMRNGKWQNAYVITTRPDQRLLDRMGAETIYIPATEEECLARTEGMGELTYQYSRFIADWFANPPSINHFNVTI